MCSVFVYFGQVMDVFTWRGSSVGCSFHYVLCHNLVRGLQVFLQVFDQPREFETGGLYYPLALSYLCEYPVARSIY